MESQHQVATRRLVDSDAEQQALEDLIEGVKPPARSSEARLHYLLATPFRYPPLAHGSRFGGRHERGIWYGADTLETVFAEVAYYRLLFLEGTQAQVGPLAVELTTFSARVVTRRGIDLTAPPFAGYASRIASRTRYDASQPLGRAMRQAGVEAFRYRSARDRAGGSAVGVFDPAAFSEPRPRGLHRWWCTATRAEVELSSRDYFTRSSYRFARSQFLVRGQLPSPAI